MNLKRRDILILLVIGLCFFFLPIIFIQPWSGISFEGTGEIGDTIGGITAPFLSFFGSILVYMALKAQIDANKQINDQFKAQKKIDYRNNFETTFFNLLNIHHNIVDSMDFMAMKLIQSESEIISHFNSNNISNIESIRREIHSTNPPVELKSRDIFKLSFVFIENFLALDLQNNVNYGNTMINKIDEFPYFNDIEVFRNSFVSFNDNFVETKFESIYNYTYNKLDTDFGHYFRNLYRMIKIVDTSSFDENLDKDYWIKYSYTSIIRAQLSDDEIKWLFFNCLTDKGKEKFKPLIEKYALLKLINVKDPIFSYYKKLYLATAFEKPTKDKVEEHLKRFSTLISKI